MHLTPILNNKKELSNCLMDCFADTKTVNSATETWDENHPNYNALMTKADEINDAITDFKADLQGKIADLQNIAEN